MKRVLIFSLAYYPLVGGAEVAVRNITDRISSDDFEFEMVTLRFRKDSPAVECIGNVFVHRIGNSTFLWKRWFQIAAFLYAKKLHRAKPFDVVWGMMAHSGGIPSMFFKSRFPNVRYVLTLQEGDPIPYIKRMMFPVWPFFVRVFRKADVVQAISIYLGEWARDMGFQGPLHIIPNGVDIAMFSKIYSKEEKASLFKNLGKKEKDIFLITTSRLVPKNGIADVIKALRFLPENFKFLILGTGPLEHSLKLLVASYQLQNRVFFLGHIDYTNIPKYLAISDIFTRPSLSEGMGNSFIEAMAAGVPVVGTPVGGIPDFLRHEETGLFCAVHDPKSIAKQSMRLLDDQALRARVIVNAQKMVAERYDWNTIAEQMKSKLTDVARPSYNEKKK